MNPITVATQVLAKASLLDARIQATRETIVAWAEVLDPHAIDTRDAFAALAQHYSAANPFPVMPGDVVTRVKAIRKDRIERESAIERDARAAANDRRLGIGSADRAALDRSGSAISAAYSVRGAISRPCPHCGAGEGGMCVNRDNGRTRALPCVARLIEAAS
jgi:hypothetical protein